MTISRRTFLSSGAIAAGAAALNTGLVQGLAESHSDEDADGIIVRGAKDRIRLEGRNGIALEIGMKDGRILGIGAVTLDGKPLRSAKEWIWPEIATPYGNQLEYLEYVDQRQEDGAIVIQTRPYFCVGHSMDWMQQDMHPIVNMRSWSAPPESPEGATFEWIFREVNESFGGSEYKGFSYAFRFRMPGRPIYQIHDKATWELGGNATGTGWIIRGGNEPYIKFESDTPMYSGWDFARSPNPHIFQHKPLYTQLQGFTFQYDNEHVLITVHDRPSHVRSAFLRLPNDPCVVHFNQFCFDLTEEHATPARKILVATRADKSETGLKNHYLRARDFIQEQHRKHYGLTYDKTQPCSHLECPGLAAMDRYPKAFRQLKEWGIKRAFIMPIWRSPDTDINPVFDKQKGRFGVFGNLCCPLELEIAELYGGWEGFEQLMSQAAAEGIEPSIWHASHFSSLTSLTERIPDLFCRDQAGQYNRNNYGHVLMTVNQRSQAYQGYLLSCYRKAKSLGLKGLFHDSHFNEATDTINFLHGLYGSEERAPSAGFAYPDDLQHNDEILSMHDTCLDLQRQLQNEIGLFYMVESEGTLGTPQTSPDYVDLHNNEWIYSNMESATDLHDLELAGIEPVEAYFRGLSTRLIFQVSIDPSHFPGPQSVANWWQPEAMVPLNVAFSRVEHVMEEMWLLEDARGVEWRSEYGKVIFAYKDFNTRFEKPMTVLDAVTGSTSQTDHLRTKALGIYLVSA